METPSQSLDIALQEHGGKLVDLTPDAARRAAEEGTRVVLVTTASWDCAAEDSELLLDGGDQRIWSCVAGRDRLAVWLADAEVQAVCADAQPDIHLCGHDDRLAAEDRQSPQGD